MSGLNLCTAFFVILHSILPVTAKFLPDAEVLAAQVMDECSLRVKTRPVSRSSECVDLNISMSPYRFRGINEHEQSFSFYGGVMIFWRHPCVYWKNLTQFSAVNSIIRKADDFWLPPLLHSNIQADIPIMQK